MTAKPQRRIEYVPLDDLVPAEKNPKGHDDAVIGSSIDRFGFIEPGILDERTGRLVAGHGRREQLIARRDAGGLPPEGVRVTAGKWFVPVVRGWASKDDTEALAAGIALNRATEKGGWTDELPALLAEIAEHSSLDGIGYDHASAPAGACVACRSTHNATQGEQRDEHEHRSRPRFRTQRRRRRTHARHARPARP